MKKPIIGITLDSEQPGGYSKFPWYAIRKNYLHCIDKFNAIPFPLFHSKQKFKDIISLIDGIIITGGNFDIDPIHYGKQNNLSRTMKDSRTDFEIKICKQSLKKNIPVLGICGGEQLINVCLGGTLIQDIKNLKIKTLNHEQINPRNETSHSVVIDNKTKLFKIFNKSKIKVNSAHHQAVDKLGKNLIVSSKSSDGIIESIESTIHNWCIGVQWHPEFLITKSDEKLIKDFVKCSRNNENC